MAKRDEGEGGGGGDGTKKTNNKKKKNRIKEIPKYCKLKITEIKLYGQNVISHKIIRS